MYIELCIKDGSFLYRIAVFQSTNKVRCSKVNLLDMIIIYNL